MDRLTVSFRKVVPTARLYEDRDDHAVRGPARVVPPASIEPAHRPSPRFQFRLPPPTV